MGLLIKRDVLDEETARFIAAELVAANSGLGKMIWDSRMYMLVDDIFVALVVLGLLGFGTDKLFRWAINVFAKRFSTAI